MYYFMYIPNSVFFNKKAQEKKIARIIANIGITESCRRKFRKFDMMTVYCIYTG